jgi:hypothetical protein
VVPDAFHGPSRSQSPEMGLQFSRLASQFTWSKSESGKAISVAVDPQSMVSGNTWSEGFYPIDPKEAGIALESSERQLVSKPMPT